MHTHTHSEKKREREGGGSCFMFFLCVKGEREWEWLSLSASGREGMRKGTEEEKECTVFSHFNVCVCVRACRLPSITPPLCPRATLCHSHTLRLLSRHWARRPRTFLWHCVCHRGDRAETGFTHMHRNIQYPYTTMLYYHFRSYSYVGGWVNAAFSWSAEYVWVCVYVCVFALPTYFKAYMCAVCTHARAYAVYVCLDLTAH